LVVADAIEVRVSMPDAEGATSLARVLVGEGLAACVNVIPSVRSIYRWQGRIQEDDEVLCLIKTRPALFDRVRQRIGELHPYQVPEVLSFAVDDGSAAYLDWMRAATGGSGA
jgi:periplasmic divalent cation tolerance protein